VAAPKSRVPPEEGANVQVKTPLLVEDAGAAADGNGGSEKVVTDKRGVFMSLVVLGLSIPALVGA